MTRKREIERPYRPEFCSAGTLAYLLDISPDTLEHWVRLGHLPEPLRVGTQRRWRLVDVEAHILARNGRGGGGGGGDDHALGSAPRPDLTPEEDGFTAGVARVKARTATHA